MILKQDTNVGTSNVLQSITLKHQTTNKTGNLTSKHDT